MRVGRLALCACMLVGCGRLAFDPIGEGTDASMTVTECPVFALFCEDFELGDLSRWSTVNTFGTGTAGVATTRRRSGSFALEAVSQPANADGNRAAPVLRFEPRSTGTLAVRAWINVAAELREFNLVLMLESRATNESVSAAGDNESEWASTEFDGNGSRDHTSTVVTPPLDAWTCVELVYTFAPAARIELFVDGTAVVDTAPAQPAPAFDQLLVGIVRADRDGFAVFVDDVVFADQRIGCD